MPRPAVPPALRALVAVFVAWPLAAAAQAGADDAAFAGSAITALPGTIVAGRPFVAAFEVHNAGPATQYSRVTFDIPTDLLLAARPPAGCFMRFDAERRELVYEGSIAAAWRGACQVEFVARPSASTQASFSLRIATPPDRHAGVVQTRPIDTPPTPAAVGAGGVGLTTAGVIVLGLLALIPVVALALRGRVPARRPGVALVIVFCVGMLGYFGHMAWTDWRTLAEYRETACEVVDGTVKFGSVSSTSARVSRPRDADTTRMPVLSVRYVADGVPRHALTFSTASRLSYSASEIEAVMAAFASGRTVPCWFDPRAPQDVLVARGFGGAYLFALIPLLVLALLVWLLRRP